MRYRKDVSLHIKYVYVITIITRTYVARAVLQTPLSGIFLDGQFPPKNMWIHEFRQYTTKFCVIIIDAKKM